MKIVLEYSLTRKRTKLETSENNDAVSWPLQVVSNVVQEQPKSKKNDKKNKSKGKGKNRKLTEEQMKEKEQQKIEKAEKKRKEEQESQEENAKQELSDEDNIDDELEGCNAPSTRKSKSVEYDDSRSPFNEDKNFSFDGNDLLDEEEEETKDEAQDEDEDKTEKKEKEITQKKVEKIVLKVPNNMAQLERDLRDLKDDFETKRNYLRNIDPKLLKPIIKSSIEIDAILDIWEIFNKSSDEWISSNHQFLISFLHGLTKLDRFDMAVEFWTDDEKVDSGELINKLRQKCLNEAENLSDQLKLIDEISDKFNI